MAQRGSSQTAGRIDIRVRYAECDPMGIAHHTACPVWLEMGRTELLREGSGLRYRDLEEQGVFFAVAKLSVHFKSPARYDDLLVLETRITGVGRAKIEHGYELKRAGSGALLATAATTLVCLDRNGRPRPLPEPLGAA